MPRYEIQANGKTFEIDAPSMPSAAQLKGIVARVGGAPRKPASPDDFTDRPAAPEGSALWRFASGAWEMLNPVTAVTGLARAVASPIETGKALIGAQFDQGRKAVDAVREGRYVEAAGHAGASILPVLGPVAAGIGEGIAETGDIATGVGRATGVVAPVLGARAAVAKAQQVGAKTGAAVKAALDPGGATTDAVRWALRNGVPVDAATATGNRVIRGAKDLADRTLGGTFTGTRAQQMRAESMKKLGRKLANDADPSGVSTAETAGDGVRGSVEGVIRARADEADAAYGRVRAAERNAQPDDVPVSRPVAAGRTIDQGFIGHWLADDLNEMGYQAGGGSKKFYDQAAEDWRPGDSEASRHGIGVGSGRVAGTPTLEMFQKAGVSGSRAEIADRIRRVLRGDSSDQKILGVIDAMGEAWDGQRFDFQLVTDDTLARTGLKRRDFKSPITLPAEDAPGAAKFFGDNAEGLRASGTEPMQFAVPLTGAKEALRPIFERLQRKKELTGTLMGDEARAATALDALVSGPDNAPLSVVDAALGDLKAAARGAAMPELRTAGQGLAAQAVKQLEEAVQARAKSAGVWEDLQAGRAATVAKWTAAETLDKLRAEPVGTFRALTQAGDAAVEKLRDVKKLAPGEMPRLGRAYLEGLMDVATAEGGFGRESKLWAEWSKLGPETKAIIYPDAELRSSLDKFFLVGKKMAENQNPSGTSYVAGIGAQGALLFADPVTGVATSLAGAALSKALNSPKIARLLTQAMETPKTAPAAKSLRARLGVALKNIAPAAAPTVGQAVDQRRRALATP